MYGPSIGIVYIERWTILKVKVMHISTANILQMVTDRANIILGIK